MRRYNTEFQPLKVVRDAVERKHIIEVMNANWCNKSVSARILGIDRKHLHNLMEKHNLKPVVVMDEVLIERAVIKD